MIQELTPKTRLIPLDPKRPMVSFDKKSYFMQPFHDFKRVSYKECKRNFK